MRQFGGFPMSSDKVTIYDIAKEAAVSPATVSRVLSGNVRVSEEKRNAVMAAVNRHHFTPNALAKDLSEESRNIIGIIAADVQNPYYSALIAACQEATYDAGCMVLLCDSGCNLPEEQEQLKMLAAQRVKAVIQIGGRVDDLITDENYANTVTSVTGQIPVVVTGKIDGAVCYRVQIHNSRALKLLMEHLISLGHRKIALVGGRMDVVSTYEKYQKYLEILQQNEIEFNPDYIITGSYGVGDGTEGARKLLSLSDMPTAAIAVNDIVAVGLIQELQRNGLSVPSDISVASYDNTFVSKLVMPHLTTIDYDYRSYGKKLVETALAAANGESVPLIQKIEPTLVVRESTAGSGTL